MNKVWMITGAARGLGRAFMQEAINHGDQVIATVRRLPQNDPLFANENVLPVLLDVTRPEQIAPAVKAGWDKFGRIDFLINNAGFGTFGAFEEISDAELRELFETDYFGLVNVTKAVLPIMRAQKSGRILNISSVSGLLSEAGCTAYSAVKYALVGLTEGLNDELKDFNIQVSALAPGSFRTDFRDPSSIRLPAQPIAAYDGMAPHTFGPWLAENNHMQAGDPQKAAVFVYKALTAPHLPTVLAIGKDCCDAALEHYEQLLADLRSYYDEAAATSFDD